MGGMACCMDDATSRRDPVKEPAMFIPFDEFEDERLRSDKKKDKIPLFVDKPLTTQELNDDREVSTIAGGTYRKEELDEFKDLPTNRESKNDESIEKIEEEYIENEEQVDEIEVNDRSENSIEQQNIRDITEEQSLHQHSDIQEIPQLEIIQQLVTVQPKFEHKELEAMIEEETHQQQNVQEQVYEQISLEIIEDSVSQHQHQQLQDAIEEEHVQEVNNIQEEEAQFKHLQEIEPLVVQEEEEDQMVKLEFDVDSKNYKTSNHRDHQENVLDIPDKENFEDHIENTISERQDTQRDKFEESEGYSNSLRGSEYDSPLKDDTPWKSDYDYEENKEGEASARSKLFSKNVLSQIMAKYIYQAIEGDMVDEQIGNSLRAINPKIPVIRVDRGKYLFGTMVKSCHVNQGKVIVKINAKKKEDLAAFISRVQDHEIKAIKQQIKDSGKTFKETIVDILKEKSIEEEIIESIQNSTQFDQPTY